jgi:hypothetical protein
MSKTFDELYEFCVDLFGADNVNVKRVSNPEAIEIYLNSRVLLPSQIKRFEFAIYRGDTRQSFMHLDDFTFEYGADEKKAITEIISHLTALHDGKLYVRYWSFLGLRLKRKIVIE